mmetsp:Transcript_31112/g.66977  ORF Transcript_31112/g.66977 Transcript_31112/m.66977 type:complete len:415 (-) Transcript_31112:458-1702(-)
MMERIHRRAAMAAMVCLCAVLASARAETVIVESETIDRLDMVNADFPHIRFTGGLVLHSDDKHFGGFSGLATTNEGRDLIAVSDKGYWLTFSVEYNDTSQSPLRVANGGEAEIEPLLDMDGIPLHDRDNKKSWSDAESVVFEDYNEEEHELWPPPLLVSFERHHRIWRYANTTAPAMTDARLSISSQLLNESCAWNGGAEAMETLPPSRVHGHAGSSLIFFCEDPIDGDKTVFQGWTVEVESTRDYDTHHLFLQLEKGYKPTDFATMDNGDLVILERRHEDGITSFRLEIIHSSLLENDLSGGSGGGDGTLLFFLRRLLVLLRRRLGSGAFVAAVVALRRGLGLLFLGRHWGFAMLAVGFQLGVDRPLHHVGRQRHGHEAQRRDPALPNDRRDGGHRGLWGNELNLLRRVIRLR